MLATLSENMCFRLLLVEEDYDFAEKIIDYMSAKECCADHATSGKQAINLLQDNSYDVIILNLNLRKMSGFDVCSNIRKFLHLKIPVIIISEHMATADILNGLRCGADDFIAKPFHAEELFVRVHAVLEKQKQAFSDVFRVGDLVLNPSKGTVERGEFKINLSCVCFRILLRLMEKSPGFVSKRDLEYDLWKDQPPLSDALKAHLWTLRARVDKPFDRQLIHTVRGRGYKIEDSGTDIC